MFKFIPSEDLESEKKILENIFPKLDVLMSIATSAGKHIPNMDYIWYSSGDAGIQHYRNRKLKIAMDAYFYQNFRYIVEYTGLKQSFILFSKDSEPVVIDHKNIDWQSFIGYFFRSYNNIRSKYGLPVYAPENITVDPHVIRQYEESMKLPEDSHESTIPKDWDTRARYYIGNWCWIPPKPKPVEKVPEIIPETPAEKVPEADL
jgi:hypothetical protein